MMSKEGRGGEGTYIDLVRVLCGNLRSSYD